MNKISQEARDCPNCAHLLQRLDAVSMLVGDGFVGSVHEALDAKGAPRGNGKGVTYGIIQRIELTPSSDRAAILEEALRGLYPDNLGSIPATLPDSHTLPLDVSIGELRRARAALNPTCEDRS